MQLNSFQKINKSYEQNVSQNSKTSNPYAQLKNITINQGPKVDQVAFKGLHSDDIVDIFSKFQTFGIKEYNKLSPTEIKLIRKNLPSWVNECKDIVVDLTKNVKKNLDNQFPEGYIFVSIGRSPEIIARALEFQGQEVKYCPISSISMSPFRFKNEILNSEKRDKHFLAYKTYLDKIGLSKTKIKDSTKMICFTDYTDEGNSLYNFEQMLKSKHIDLDNSNICYKSLNKDLILENSNKKEYDVLSDTIFEYFNKSRLKVFSRYKRIALSDINSVKNIKQPTGTIDNKEMDFALIDYYINNPDKKGTKILNIIQKFMNDLSNKK